MEGHDNEYNVVWVQRKYAYFKTYGCPKIRFENNSPGNRDIALPNPEYLALHAAVTRILHHTGLGEYINDIVDLFTPDSSTILLEKFRGEELDLRISLMEMFRPTPVYG